MSTIVVRDGLPALVAVAPSNGFVSEVAINGEVASPFEHARHGGSVKLRLEAVVGISGTR